MSDNTTTVGVPEGTPFIDISREFDAPAAALYRAHAEPELVTRWLGPAGYVMEIEEWELRTGGRYRYIHRSTEGDEFAFNGVFHVARPDLIIQTFEWEGVPDVVSVESMRIEDLGDGRSRLSIHSTYPSQEARDGMAASDMEKGMTEGYRKLDGVLASL